MKLSSARLCLDCEEIHGEDHCPACGSESFAFLTRWIKPEKPVLERRPVPPERAEQVQAYRDLLEPKPPPPKLKVAGKVLAHGALGLAILGAARLIWRARTLVTDEDTGAADQEDLRNFKADGPNGGSEE